MGTFKVNYVIRRNLGVVAFTHVYFLNGHGGNEATVKAAFQEIYALSSYGDADMSDLRLKLNNWYSTAGVGRLSKQLYGDQEGSHATPSEVSLTFYAYPDEVKTATLSPTLAPTGVVRDADDYRAQFADGRIGSNPALATVDAGESLFKASVADIREDYCAFLAS